MWLYKSGFSSIRSMLGNEKDSPCFYAQQVANTSFPLYGERRWLLLLHFILATIGLYLLFAKWIKCYALGVTCWSSRVMNIPLIPLFTILETFLSDVAPFKGCSGPWHLMWSQDITRTSASVFKQNFPFLFYWQLLLSVVRTRNDVQKRQTINLFSFPIE